MHYIQKHILAVLTRSQNARFAELRPARTDSNLFSYHLKTLLKEKLVEKIPEGYTLSAKGLAFVDRISEANFEPRLQPKIITMAVVLNKQGEVLIQRRVKQPFINTWTLPSGKLHLDDESILQAAEREVKEKTGLKPPTLKHVGDCYIKVSRDREVISSVLAHLFLGSFSGNPTLPVGSQWQKIDTLRDEKLAPAIQEITTSVIGGNSSIFKEIQVNL